MRIPGDDLGGYKGSARLNGLEADVHLVASRERVFDGRGRKVRGGSVVGWVGTAAIINTTVDVSELIGEARLELDGRVAEVVITEVDLIGGRPIRLRGLGRPPFDLDVEG